MTSTSPYPAALEARMDRVDRRLIELQQQIQQLRLEQLERAAKRWHVAGLAVAVVYIAAVAVFTAAAAR